MKIIPMTIELEQEIYGKTDPYTEDGKTLLNIFLAEENAYYYGCPNEDFSIQEGIDLAEKQKCNMLITENLS